MEYKKNKKKFPLDFKKKVAEAAVANKRKLEEERPDNVYNEKRRKWTQPGTQVGYKALTARQMFPDMKNEKNDTPDFKSCVKFVGRCEDLLVNGQFDIEGNAVGNKFRIAGAGAPKKCVSVRRELFDFFIDIRSTLKGRLPKKIFIAKAKSLYEDYCEWKREEGVEPETMLFSNRWLKDWCKEYQISMKKPNKRFSISAADRKKRIMDYLKNVWTVRHTFVKLYGVDPEIIMSDQMPLHRNESSNEKTLNFKGAAQTTYVKENHSLSRERITVMTSVSSGKQATAPKLEFIFKGAGKRVKLDPPSGVTVQWAPKGSYRLEHVQNFCDKVPPNPCALFPQKRKIYSLDDYSAHLDPSVQDSLLKRGYFLIVMGGGITGDLQVNDTDMHHPLKEAYREKESSLMIEKLRENPEKIPSSSRNDIMRMCKSAFQETVAKIDFSDAFKRNGLTIKLDGSEDHLVSSKIKTLVWEEMIKFRSDLLKKPHPRSLQKLRDIIIPPDGVKRKLDQVVEGVPPDEGFEMMGGDITDDDCDDNDDDDDDDVEEEDIQDAASAEEASTSDEIQLEDNPVHVDPELKVDLDSIARIEDCIRKEKKSSSSQLLPFLVKVENMLSGERARRRAEENKLHKTKEIASIGENLGDVNKDSNAFDIFE